MKFSLFTQKAFSGRKQYYLHLLILSAILCIVYYPTVDAPFIFDDFPNIVTNPAVHPENAGDLLNVFHSDFSRNRPLAMLSFALNYLFGGLNVFGYHFVNIVIHILTALILYNVFTILPVQESTHIHESETIYHRQNIAFWGASLWALNPIQTQAVTYIVQRMTSLASLFYLIAVYVFIRLRNHSIPAGVAFPLLFLSFVLGISSKEIVITLPVILLAIDYFFFTKTVTKQHKIALFCFVASSIPLFFIYLNGSFPDFFQTYPNRNFSPWERVMTEWRVIWHYLSLYSFPFPERMHLAYDVSISRGILSPWTTLFSLIAISSSWLFAWRYRFKLNTLVFSWFFFFITLALESTFLNLEIAFAHRLYLPTAFLLFGLLTIIKPHFFQKISFITFLLLALWSSWTIVRNDEWINSKKFWQTELIRGAGAARALNNQGAIMIEAGKYHEAVSLFMEGLTNAQGEDRMLLLYNLGMTYFYLEKYEDSIKTYTILTDEFGSFEYTNLFIGQGHLILKRMTEAKNLVDRLLQNKQLAYQGKILQSNILRDEGKFAEAEDILQELLHTTPKSMTDRHLKARQELAIVYLMSGNIKSAYETYLEIIDLFPDNYFAWRQIYKMQIAANDIKNANKIKSFLESKGVSLREDNDLQ